MAKIVVVDNEPLICDFIRDGLEQHGHEVRVAKTGDDAIDFGYLFEPDILIADWNLESEYNGLEVADAFNFANTEVKTIVISGHAEALTGAKGKRVFETLVKPFSFQRLLDVVDQALSCQAEIRQAT